VGDAGETGLALTAEIAPQLSNLVQLRLQTEPACLVLLVEPLMQLEDLIIDLAVLAVQLTHLHCKLLPAARCLPLEQQVGQFWHVVQLEDLARAAL
jgi:hypothetical protein